MYDGDTHGADQMPMVLGGGARGGMKTGRVLDNNDKGNDNRRACTFYLSIRGMRITVALGVNLVANGMSTADIIREYPELEK